MKGNSNTQQNGDGKRVEESGLDAILGLFSFLIKTNLPKNSLWILLLILFIFNSITYARTSRVLVVFKTQASFYKVKSNFEKFGSLNYKYEVLNRGQLVDDAFSQDALTGHDVQVQSSLGNLNSVVLAVRDEAEISKLMNNSEVAYVEREVWYPAPKPVEGFLRPVSHRLNTMVQSMISILGNFQATAKTPWGILAIKANDAWKISSGKTARVLVLDTGIDKEHPSLKANFEKGKSFVEDNSGDLPYPFFDDVGHGSHCAGTIAGVSDSSGFSGVAPDAKILSGKVCIPEGCSNISIAEGINWGITEKVDVISMSLGGNLSTPAERKSVSDAISKGLVIVAASGNGAGDPGYEPGDVSYPAALPKVIAVGAVNSKLERAAFSQYGPSLTVVGPGVGVLSTVPQGTGLEGFFQVKLGSANSSDVPNAFFEGAAKPTQVVTNEVALGGLGKPDELAAGKVAGKFALVNRGELKFLEKAKNAIEAKAQGLIIVNTDNELVQGGFGEPTPLSIPVVMIGKEAGSKMQAAVQAGQKVQVSLQVKKTNYAALSGTSMATPHVAGLVALIKGYNHNLNADQVKNILVKTAKPLGPNTQNEFGAGLVQADAAMKLVSGN